MVQAMINIDENTNRVLNIVKAKFGLKDKSQVIDWIVKKYEENFLEPELRPEFVKKIQKIEKRGKFIEYKKLSDLRRAIES